MPRYRYLIVGGGMAAYAAVCGIREVDPAGPIGMVSTEHDPPYKRPPLSKSLWKGRPLDTIWYKLESLGVEPHLSTTVTSIDLPNKILYDNTGTAYAFQKLLLATGGTPRRLPFGDDRIIYFRTMEDYRRLRTLTEVGDRFCIIGGGFVGSEIAAALAMNGKDVVMVFPGKTIGSHLFPAGLGKFLNHHYRQKGVELLPGNTVTGVKRGKRLDVRIRSVHRSGDREVRVDGIVAGIGIEPNTGLARQAGLEVENGLVVDAHLRTAHPDVYSAGDVAAFYNPFLRKRLRVEHEDNAKEMGRVAGRAMAGDSQPYHHLPSFDSRLFEMEYEAVGEADARLETVDDLEDPSVKGIVYYVRERRVRGVLLWNVREQVDTARRLIAEPGPFRPEDLKGRLPVPN